MLPQAGPLPAQALPSQTGTPPERIDLTVPPPERESIVDPACQRKQDAAIISGEIVVCAAREASGPGDYDKEKAEDRYAAKTQGQSTPDLFGIPNHGMIVLRGCFIPPCPKPPALMIDVAALPEAPAGSDADRIARGLAPLDQTAEQNAPPLTPAQQCAALGLPDPEVIRAERKSAVSDQTPSEGASL